MSGFGQCCGIDEAIKTVEECVPDFRAELIKNRLEYHRNQAEGVKPKYYKADSALHSYYKCGHCGHRVENINNFCPNCGYMIKWDSTRCLTGLPLVDMAEKEEKENGSRGNHPGGELHHGAPGQERPGAGI